MGNFVYLVALFGLFTTGLTAPLKDGTVRGHRDSTKAILNLEQELKESAGEDKQFAPPDDSVALAQLAAEGQKLHQAQDQAALDELSALQNDAPGGLTLEQMHALENEPVADVDEEDLESLVGEPGEEEEVEDDGHNTDTFKEKIGIQSDKKSPYKVVAVSEKKASKPPAFDLPDVPPQVDMEYPTQPQEYRDAQIEDDDDDDDDDSFMTHFQSVVEKYPELMEFMNDPDAIEQYQRMVLAPPDYLDRDEAMQAEMLAAQQPGMEGDYTDVRPVPQDAYVDYGTAARHEPAQEYNNEREQEFAGDNIAHAVAAKKRGYDTPEEYLEWMKASQHEAAVPNKRAAELMQQLPQQLSEEDVHMAM